MKNMTNTPHYEFIYFNFRGKGEISRLLFAYAGVDYDDVRIPFSDWPAFKAETPYGQLPLLKVNNQTLAQSKAIARYLADEFELAGKSRMDRAKADMVVEVVHNDIMAKAVELYYEKDEVKKETLRKEYSEYLEHMFTKFQDQLRENGGQFFVGNELTWADLAVADCVDWPRDSGIDLDMEKYPVLRTHQETVYAIPNIKEWLQKRPVTMA